MTPRRSILAATCLGLALAAQGAPRDDLTELRGRIAVLKKQLGEAEETKAEAADALKDSESAISDASRRLFELAQERRAADAELARLQAQGKRTGGAIQAQQAQLGRLLYRQYLGAQPDALKLLLGGRDPSETARHLHYYGHIAQARAELLQNLRANLAQLRDLSAATREKSVQLARLHAEETAQKKRLEREKAARKAVLARVSKQIGQQRREIVTLKRNENRLARLVERLGQMLARKPALLRNDKLPDAAWDGTPFRQLQGRLNLPVRGELTNRFGSPRSDSGLSWKGLFIRSPSGQEVRAVASGRVVFADWLRGFGNLMILDHGGGYMSLYGNNETLYRQVGEAVRGGDAVAAVGNSGGNADSGLYFELRHEGRPFDPLAWTALK